MKEESLNIKPDTRKAKSFWKWFTKNKSSYMFLDQVSQDEKGKLLDVFIKELYKYSKNVYFEIGGDPKDEKIDLIITAEGVRAYFETVEFLVDKAPKFKDWKVIAFKPPLGIGFKVKLGTYEFEPNKTIFIPLSSEEEPNGIGIKVCFPDYTQEEQNIFTNGTFFMLDIILGEKSVALDIDYIDVVKTPEDILNHPFMYLSEIKKFIDKKKGREKKT